MRKVNYSPVANGPLLLKLQERGIEMPYLLVLAHEVLRTPDAFLELLVGRDSDVVILDNGVVELGEPLEFEQLWKAASVVFPDYIVCPDIQYDAEATLQATAVWCEEYHSRSDFGAVKPALMGVAQGKSAAEAIKCAERLRDFTDAIGIPKLIKDRPAVVREVQHMGFEFIHLLGFGDPLCDFAAMCISAEVLGIDSAVPLHLALMGRECTVENLLNPPMRRNMYWGLLNYAEYDLSEELINRCVANIAQYNEIVKQEILHSMED